MTYKGWYALKPDQPTSQHILIYVCDHLSLTTIISETSIETRIKDATILFFVNAHAARQWDR